jgi:hypothetical protein
MSNSSPYRHLEISNFQQVILDYNEPVLSIPETTFNQLIDHLDQTCQNSGCQLTQNGCYKFSDSNNRHTKFPKITVASSANKKFGQIKPEKYLEARSATQGGGAGEYCLKIQKN